MDNRLGLKYKSGVKPDEACLLKNELTELLCGSSDGKSGTLTYYYPMPDYRLPVTIYSDEYLPVKGNWLTRSSLTIIRSISGLIRENFTMKSVKPECLKRSQIHFSHMEQL